MERRSPASAADGRPGPRGAGTDDYLARCVAALAGHLEPRTAGLLSLERAARAGLGADEIAARHRTLARMLHERHAPMIAAFDGPADVREGFAAEFARIATEVERKPAEHFTFANYRFKADLRILSLRRIPAGMLDLEVGGIPRRLLFAQGPAGGLRLALAVARAGGFAPFFSSHMAGHRMHLFSPAERERFLGRTAELVRRRPGIRGLTSTGWWNDPAVGRIAPHLAYLGEWFERYGMGVFVIGTNPNVVQEATAFSFERKRLVESGRYQPTAYLGLALRSQLLRRAPEPS